MNSASIKKLMDKVYSLKREKVIKFLTTAGLMIERDAKSNFKAQTRYGTGQTAATIISIVDDKAENPTCKIGSPSNVLAFREFGTSPHKSPEGSAEFVESVTRWGKRQGMTDEEIDSVIYFIRKYGTKPRPALYPAFYQNKDAILELAKRTVANG